MKTTKVLLIVAGTAALAGAAIYFTNPIFLQKIKLRNEVASSGMSVNDKNRWLIAIDSMTDDEIKSVYIFIEMKIDLREAPLPLQSQLIAIATKYNVRLD